MRYERKSQGNFYQYWTLFIILYAMFIVDGGIYPSLYAAENRDVA